MKINEAIIYQNIDTWNKENPEETFTYEEVQSGLEEAVEGAVEGIIDSFLEKYYEGHFYVETDYITSDAVNYTDAIDGEDFKSLVLEQIASCKIRRVN